MDGSYLGSVLALFSAACFAGASYCISRTTQSKGDKGTMFSVLVTMVMSFGLWIVTGREGLSGGNPAAGLAWFVLAGLLAMLLGRSFMFVSVRTLGVARSSAIKRLNPFFSVLLGAALLGEIITASSGAGIALIALSFGFLIAHNLKERAVTGRIGLGDYVPGIVAAMCYALAYVTRKFGLVAMPSPMLGTFVSAFSGFAAFGLIAVVSANYRDKFVNMFAHLDRWILMASVLMSAGQILFFTALASETLTKVAMITSTEIFIGIILASFVFRTEPVPSGRIIAAAALAMAGVILIAID